MEELSGPVFTVKDFATGVEPVSGQPVVVLITEESDVAVAYVISRERARRLGESLIRLHLDHNVSPGPEPSG